MHRRLCLLLLSTALLASTSIFAQRSITLDDFLNGERVTGVELSGDGNYVLEHFTDHREKYVFPIISSTFVVHRTKKVCLHTNKQYC